MSDSGDARALLRHTLATLAYRASKALRDAPREFADHRISPTSRTPLQLVGHLGDLFDWAFAMTEGKWTWAANSIGEWDAEVERFFAALARLDARLASGEPLGHSPEVIFQGPIADALTHVGQLNMIRGAIGAPVRPESYGRATIKAGRVGRDQPAPKAEYEGDASAKRR